MYYIKSFSADQFDNSYKRAKKSKFEGVPFTVIHMDDLMKEKKAVNRKMDQNDVIELEKIKRNKNKGMSM